MYTTRVRKRGPVRVLEVSDDYSYKTMSTTRRSKPDEANQDDDNIL